MYKKINWMKNLIIALFLLSLCIIGCNKSQPEKPGNSNEEEYSFCVTPFKPLLFSDDHTSEGFLAPLSDGRILLLFRLDPGIDGNHVGNDGYIAKIPYDPETDQWGEVQTVYNSHQYDDRNIHGGVTKEGRIVLFFRSFDGEETRGRYVIYSDDDGETWSDLQNAQWTWGTGQMFYNEDIGKYAMLGRQRYITFSKDGILWEDPKLITNAKDYKLSELAGAWCGDNRIIALQRDDAREYGYPLRQLESYDNGETWTDPVQTNIPPHMHWGAAPQLYYDQARDLLIAMNSDRYSRPDKQNSLFIYTARPEEVMGNPKGWRLQFELLRPWAALNFAGDRPLNFNLYGYPTIAPVNEQEYLIVFTERAWMHGTEQADLYYFRLIIK
jgi:hypothetical protein